MRLVAVTACPTGIAHTYMAAEAIEEAARAAGHEIKVETQGAAGATPLSDEDIARADAVIFAADIDVRGRERFAGKPIIDTGVKQGIQDAAGLVAQAVAAARSSAAKSAPADPAGKDAVAAAEPPAPATRVDRQAGFGTHLRQWLMTGVSYMIPFVAAGGILIALSYMLGGAEIASRVNGGTYQGHTYAGVTDISQIFAQTGLAGLMFKIGTTALMMLAPILAGFIAYAIADRPGLVPGIVSGLLAGAIGAGFLGALIGGLLAGGVVVLLSKPKVPRALAGIMTVVVIPVVSTLIMGALMLLVIGPPVAALQTALTDWLAGLSGANAVLLGALLGLMMASDLGGPLNKVAYTFGLASLAGGDIKVMAAVMAAGMTPPIAMALATVLRPTLFTRAERRAGEAAWLLGASFITEGAIPFAAADPLRVIPSAMAGSALAGALSMAFGATSRAPHGGIWVLPLIGNPLLWVAAIAAGIVLSAACVVVAKHIGRRRGSVADLESPAATAGGPAATAGGPAATLRPTGPGPQ